MTIMQPFFQPITLAKAGVQFEDELHVTFDISLRIPYMQMNQVHSAIVLTKRPASSRCRQGMMELREVAEGVKICSLAVRDDGKTLEGIEGPCVQSRCLLGFANTKDVELQVDLDTLPGAWAGLSCPVKRSTNGDVVYWELYHSILLSKVFVQLRRTLCSGPLSD
jgi:hypothetical protein